MRSVKALKSTSPPRGAPWKPVHCSIAKGRKTQKTNLLRRANNPPSSNDVTESRSKSHKPACAGNGYRKPTAQTPADDDIRYVESMTLPDQSETEVRRLTTSLTKPKVVNGVHKHDILLVLGDLNVKVGEDNEGYENIIGSHGVGEINDKGERLVDFCGLNNLVVTGTISPHKLMNKHTWTPLGGRLKNQIDHVLVSRQHRPSVMDTRAMRGADIASEHQLVP